MRILLIISGLVIGTVGTLVIVKAWLRNGIEKQYSERFEAILSEIANRLSMLPPQSSISELLASLYDKRLTLFNVRREHEWKIYFGALVLLGAVDAAVVSCQLVLNGLARYAWILACFVLFAVVWGYEAELQKSNATDRAAMNHLYNRICDLLTIPLDSPIREPIIPKNRNFLLTLWYRYGWAFPWQMLLLALAVAASMYLPFHVTCDKQAKEPVDRVFIHTTFSGFKNGGDYEKTLLSICCSACCRCLCCNCLCPYSGGDVAIKKRRHI